MSSVTVDEVIPPASGLEGVGLTRVRGLLVLGSASRRVTQVREDLGGSENPRFDEEDLREDETQESSGHWLRFAGVMRTDSRRDQSFEAGEAGGSERSRQTKVQGDREAGRLVKREPIVVGGTWRGCRTARCVGETAR